MFKSLQSVPPWELRKDLLVVPVALTLLMLEKAFALWVEFKNNPVAKSKYCIKGHRLSHDDCFDYFKRKMTEYGYKTAAQFSKAVNSALKRKQRQS